MAESGALPARIARMSGVPATDPFAKIHHGIFVISVIFAIPFFMFGFAAFWFVVARWGYGFTPW
jgi:hypothetical protein